MFLSGDPYSLPSWQWIDITNAFDALWELLLGLWNWSDVNGIILYGEYVCWRDIIVAGLVIALMLRKIFGEHENEWDDAVAEAQSQFNRGNNNV